MLLRFTDSGSTHAFCLEKRSDLKWPASMYLEAGSTQRLVSFVLLEPLGQEDKLYESVLTMDLLLMEKVEKCLNHLK